MCDGARVELKWTVTGLFLWVKIGFISFGDVWTMLCYVPNSYEQLFLVKPKILEHCQRPRKSHTLEALGIYINMSNHGITITYRKKTLLRVISAMTFQHGHVFYIFGQFI